MLLKVATHTRVVSQRAYMYKYNIHIVKRLLYSVYLLGRSGSNSAKSKKIIFRRLEPSDERTKVLCAYLVIASYSASPQVLLVIFYREFLLFFSRLERKCLWCERTVVNCFVFCWTFVARYRCTVLTGISVFPVSKRICRVRKESFNKQGISSLLYFSFELWYVKR